MIKKRIVKAYGVFLAGDIFRSELHNGWARIFKTKQGAKAEYHLREKDKEDFKVVPIEIHIKEIKK